MLGRQDVCTRTPGCIIHLHEEQQSTKQSSRTRQVFTDDAADAPPQDSSLSAQVRSSSGRLLAGCARGSPSCSSLLTKR